MRQCFVENLWEAKQLAWAQIITKVQGGWMCFESIDDYHVWKKQK